MNGGSFTALSEKRNQIFTGEGKSDRSGGVREWRDDTHVIFRAMSTSEVSRTPVLKVDVPRRV